MTNEGLSRFGLFVLDRLTDLFPRVVPRIFQTLFLKFMGSRLFSRAVIARYRRSLGRITLLQSVLILADVGIGDAVMVQQSVVAMRSLFPAARIDYACNRSAGELLLPLPQADQVYPVFEVHGRPSIASYERLRTIVAGTHYTLILNLSPFLDGRRLSCSTPVVNLYVPLASYIVSLWRSPGKPRHISIAVRDFLYEFFSGSGVVANMAITDSGPDRTALTGFPGNELYLSDEAIDHANDFLRRERLHMSDCLVFFNPDSATRYTHIPLDLQLTILKHLAASEEVNAILLGEAYSQSGIEQRLLDGLPPPLRSRIVVVPHVPLSTYSAIVDACDLFLSGDGGPVHVAAAWKCSSSGNRVLRNRTAVFTVFGGTDARMYGYDSNRDGYVGAAQRAPSKVFVAPAPCRNITCVDKLGKTCREIRCFSGFHADRVSDQVIAYLRSSEKMRHSA
ncbi:MAG: hypothetical protein WB699_04470 [Bacteroidota bacterium]